jgi:diguanylate cyclase (GGDEF)-like protein
MDPFTVVVMLAIHLVGSGGLMFLVWRLMPDAPGLGRWWVASCLFGLAYVGRLFAGFGSVGLHSMAEDALMLFAVLLFSDGVREFVGRQLFRWQVTALLWFSMFAGTVAATLLGGAAARHVVLNLCIGCMYAAVVWTIAFEVRRQPAPLRAPLRLLAAMLGGLSALTLLRAESIFTERMEVAFKGPLAQTYYMYASLTALVVALTLLWMLFLRLNGRLADLASRDPLTGTLNRNGLDDMVKRHFARRDAAPLSVLLLDIDHFKRINDSFGHATGDAVLKAVANTLVSHLRAEDFVARIGGEEFLIGCASAESGIALALAQRLNKTIGQLEVRSANGAGSVMCTVSVGVSGSIARLADWDLGARQADQALYQAKAEGRNGVRPFMAPAAA